MLRLSLKKSSAVVILGLVFTLLFLVQSAPVFAAPPTGVYLNELLVDPDVVSDNPNEYVEIRGPANQSLSGVYLIFLEGDPPSSGPLLGAIQGSSSSNIIDLTGESIGSNGYLVILDDTADPYSVAAGTTIVDVPGLDIENASYTAFLIHVDTAGTAPVANQDLDVGDDGLDALPTDWTILDGISVLDGASAAGGGANDRGYADIVFSANADGLTESGATFVNTGFGADDVIHLMRKGDTTGSSTADWVAFELDSTPPNFEIEQSTDAAYVAGTVITNHLGETNPTGVSASLGNVTIIKDTVPNSGDDFNFTTTGGLPLASFILDDDSDPTRANNISFNNIAPGSYTVTEAATAGYATTLSCVDPDDGTTTSGATANIDLDAGETVTCTYTNTADQTPPVLTAPADLTLEAPADMSPANTGTATATDNLDPNPTITFSDVLTPGSCPANFILTRAWTATDLFGNQATVQQTITSQDTTPPSLTIPADITVNLGDSTSPSNTGTATATDAVSSASVSWTDNQVGNVITRTWFATDNCGNQSLATQTITINSVITTSTVVVDSANLNGWASAVETGSANFDFVDGPATPPLGNGSAQFMLNDTAGGVFIGTQSFAGTRFDQIIDLEYSTYNTVGNNLVAPALQFNVDYDLTDSTATWQGRLVFEPYQDPSNTVTDGIWQTWDPLAGRWWSTGTPVVGDAAAAQSCPHSSPCDWPTVLSNYPDAGIQTGSLSALLLKAGSSWPIGYKGSVDKFVIQVGNEATIYDFEPAQGSITIKKNVIGSDFSDLDFDFTFDGSTPFSISENDTAGYVQDNLPAGTYNVTESVPSGWDLTSIDCGVGQNNTAAVDGVNIVLETGEDVVCTFNNTPLLGTIVIIQNTIPDGSQDFSFTTSGGLSPATFNLDDDADGTLSNTQTYNNVPVGSYNVTQTPVPGYTTVVVCSGSDFNSSTTGLTSNIELDANETVTCRYTSAPTSGESCSIKDGLIEHLPSASSGFAPANPAIIGSGQSFTVPAGVTEAEGIEVYFGSIQENASLILSLHEGPATHPVGPAIASATYTNPGSSISDSNGIPISFEFDAPVSLTPGNSYYYVVSLSYPAPLFKAETTNASYAGGNVFDVRTNGFLNRTWDALFSVYSCIPPVVNLEMMKDDGGISVEPGDVIPYTLVVTNSGDLVTNNVTFTETVPANTTFDLAGSTVGWTCPDGAPANSACTINVGTLAPGASTSAVFAVEVDNPLSSIVTEIFNDAGVLYDGINGPDVDLNDNTAEDSTPVIHEGSITIVKEVIYVADIDVDSDRDFPFFSSELGNFFLDDPLIDDSDGITESITFADLTAGEYTITEGPNGNWIQSVECEGDAGVVYLDPDVGATIDLDAGEDVVCTFTNERVTYDLTYEKVLAPNTPIPPTDWEFTLASLQNLVPGDIDIDFGVVTTATAAGGSSDTLTLPLAAYKVGEVVPGNYELVQIDCGPGGLSTSPPVNDQFTIILDQNLTCTFTNQTTKAEIMLTKNVINNHGGTAGVNDFGLSIGGTLVNSGQTILVTANQPVTIDEVGLEGYDFVSITGHAKCPAILGGSMTPAPGEQISCTITNDDQPGTLIIIKDTVPNDPQDFSFSVTGGLIPANFLLDDDANATLDNTRTYSGIPTGTYEITEAAVPGFDTFINCVDESGDTTVSGNKATAKVALGETVTCTFTNEKQIPEISISDAEIVEGTGGTTTLEFTVTRTNNYFATSVKVNSSDGTADSPADYAAIVNEMVTFAPGGSLSKVVSVDITTDAIVEADETFLMTLSDAVNGTIDDGEAIGTILNDDKATLKLSGGTSRTETDSGQVAYVFYALLLDEVQGGFTLDFATKDLTATAADGDYDAVSGTLTFTGDFGGNVDERHTITVYVNGDHKVEPDEVFAMQIVGGPHTPLASDIMVTTEVGRFDLDFHTAKIFNDDSAKVTLTGAETVTEGDSGNTFVKYTATLDNPVEGGFKIPFSTLSGSASNTSDFVDNDQTLTFSGNAGESKSVTVRVTGDELVEADETFYVSLGNFSGTTLGGKLSVAGSPKIVTIENDDTATVTLSGGTAKLEGDSGTVAFTFDVTLDADVDGGFDLAYATNDGTAELSDNDYVDNDGTLRFNGSKGETKTVTVLVNGDFVGEAHETFELALGAAVPDKSGITIHKAGSPQKATITNDDTAVFFIDVANIKVSESAGSIPFEVTLSNTVATTTTVDYHTSDGTAVDGVDYTGVSGTLTFAPGEGVKVIQIPIIDDNIDEPDESVIVTLSNSSGAGFGNPSVAELVIADDEPTPEVNIDGSPLMVSESVSSLTIVVSLSGPSSATVEVDINSANGSATAGNDYTAVSERISFAPGETSKSITLEILSDTIYEGDETLTLSLSNVENANLGVEATEVVTILEDSLLPGISIASVSMVEPESGEATMQFEVLLSKAAAVDISVDFTTLDGSAVAGEDYVATSGTLVIKAGTTKGTISVTVLADSTQEGDETFSLILSSPIGGELDPTAAVGVKGVIKTNKTVIFLPLVGN